MWPVILHWTSELTTNWSDGMWCWNTSDLLCLVPIQMKSVRSLPLGDAPDTTMKDERVPRMTRAINSNTGVFVMWIRSSFIIYYVLTDVFVMWIRSSFIIYYVLTDVFVMLIRSWLHCLVCLFVIVIRSWLHRTAKTSLTTVSHDNCSSPDTCKWTNC